MKPPTDLKHVPAMPLPKVLSASDFATMDRKPAPLPSFGEMAKSASASAIQWASGGFQWVTPEEFNARIELCRGCEFWDAQGFFNTGRCRKCGCSTKAKLRMATASCPIGKWGPTKIYAKPTTNTNGNNNDNTATTGRSPDIFGEVRVEGLRDSQVP